MTPSFKCQQQRDHNVFGRLWMSHKRCLPCDFNARTCILLGATGVLMTSRGVINRPRLLANGFCQLSMGFIKFYCRQTHVASKKDSFFCEYSLVIRLWPWKNQSANFFICAIFKMYALQKQDCRWSLKKDERPNRDFNPGPSSSNRSCI